MFPSLSRHKFQINRSFLIKLFFYTTKTQNKNFNILKKKKTLSGYKKNIFINFEGISVARNDLKPESRTLRAMLLPHRNQSIDLLNKLPRTLTWNINFMSYENEHSASIYIDEQKGNWIIYIYIFLYIHIYIKHIL